MNTPYTDLTDTPDVDEVLKAELRAAGIHVVVLPVPLSGIPSSCVVGQFTLPGEPHSEAWWQFIRCRTYWQAQGPGIPPEYAEALYASHGQEVRAEGRTGGKAPSDYCPGFAVGYYEADTPAGLKALADTIRQVIKDALQRQLEKRVTDADINERVEHLLADWLFPGECYHTPDAASLARSNKLRGMLRRRMRELRESGIDPRTMSIKDLLPGVIPDEIELTEADF